MESRIARLTEESKKLRVGIIGLGQMGILHGAIVNSLPSRNVAAISDNDSRITKVASKVCRDIHFYVDYAEMIERESLDALFVCTPMHIHAPILLDVARRFDGRGVFVEKPLASTYSDAQNLAEAFKVLDRVTMVGFQKRHAGPFRRAKEFLDKGVIGQPVFFQSHFYSSHNLLGAGPKFEENGIDVAIDFSPHPVDMLMWFFGEPDSINSVGRPLSSCKVNDYVHSVFNFNKGLIGTLDVCWSMRTFDEAEIMIEVHGKRGTMNVTENRLIIHLDTDVPGLLPVGSHLFPAPSLTPPLPCLFASPDYVLSDQYFLNCVESHNQTETSFESAAKVNKIIEMIRGQVKERVAPQIG